MATRLILLCALAAAAFLSLAVALNSHDGPHPAAAPRSTRNKHAHGRHEYRTLLAHRTTLNRKRDERPPEPYPGFYDRVDKCLQKLSDKCGREIFVSILGDGAKVSDSCCLSLVAMGRRCHRNILKATLALPQFSKRERGDIMNRDANVWGECVLVSDGFRFGPNKSRRTPSPAPSPTN